MIPRQLFDWACTNVPAVYFGYCSNEDYMQENGVVWSNTFNSHARSLVRENCTLSYLSQIAQWKSDSTWPQMLPGKRESPIAKNDIPPDSIAKFVMNMWETGYLKKKMTLTTERLHNVSTQQEIVLHVTFSVSFSIMFFVQLIHVVKSMCLQT